VYGTGTNTRDWVHVADHCAALDLLLKADRVEGETFNVGVSAERSILQIGEAILEALAKPKSLLQRVPDRPGHVVRHAVDWTKLRHRTGWMPKTTFEIGLRETIDWYRANEWWWRPIRAVAERAGKILGFASLRLVPSLDSTPYAELSDLFVARPYRRQGVGRRLLEFVETRARERGADRLVLTTGLKNVDAGRFYRALGFEDHALAMKKSLGGGKSSRLREIRTPRRAVLWRRDEPTGTESFLLSGDEGGWHLEGD